MARAPWFGSWFGSWEVARPAGTSVNLTVSPLGGVGTLSAILSSGEQHQQHHSRREFALAAPAGLPAVTVTAQVTCTVVVAPLLTGQPDTPGRLSPFGLDVPTFFPVWRAIVPAAGATLSEIRVFNVPQAAYPIGFPHALVSYVYA